VRSRDLPGDIAAYESYFAQIASNVLQDNSSVQSVIASLRDPAAPPLPRYAQPAWRLGRLPSVHALSLATTGLLAPPLRERFGLRWTRANEVELRALAAASRATVPLMPRRVRMLGPAYLRWRGSDNVWRPAEVA
jgi:uncharacterized protein (DUF2236 family)